MPLTSQPLFSAAGVQTRDNGDTFVRAKFSREFHVSPSPCHNIGNMKAPTPYDYWYREISFPVGRLDAGYWWGGIGSRQYVANGLSGVLSGYLVDGNQPPATPYSAYLTQSNVRSKAVSKFYDSLKNSEINLATSVGEGRESLEMMHGIAASSAKPIEGLKSLLKKAGRRPLVREMRTVGGLFLAWQVGLAPLLSDVKALQSHLLSDAGKKLSVHVKARSSGTDVAVDGNWTTERSYRTEFGADVSITDLHTFENWRAGLNIRPTLAWELTTLSFVVDYFINVGDLLESYESAVCNNGFIATNIYETSVVHETHVYRYFRAGNSKIDWGALTGSASYWQGQGQASGSAKYVGKSRSILQSVPVQFAPIIKLPKAASQLFTIAALLSQLLKR